MHYAFRLSGFCLLECSTPQREPRTPNRKPYIPDDFTGPVNTGNPKPKTQNP
jgi:hypothetical protein